MADTKIVDDRYLVPKKRGNGQIRRETWIDKDGNVTRYNLAYINHFIFPGDNGRVLGYDNRVGYHHRHFMGMTEPCEHSSLEELEKLFEKEWNKLLPPARGAKRI